MLGKFHLINDKVGDWLELQRRLMKPDWLQIHPRIWLPQFIEESRRKIEIQGTGGPTNFTIRSLTVKDPKPINIPILFITASDKYLPKINNFPKSDWSDFTGTVQKYYNYKLGVSLRILGYAILAMHCWVNRARMSIQ